MGLFPILSQWQAHGHPYKVTNHSKERPQWQPDRCHLSMMTMMKMTMTPQVRVFVCLLFLLLNKKFFMQTGISAICRVVAEPAPERILFYISLSIT